MGGAAGGRPGLKRTSAEARGAEAFVRGGLRDSDVGESPRDRTGLGDVAAVLQRKALQDVARRLLLGDEVGDPALAGFPDLGDGPLAVAVPVVVGALPVDGHVAEARFLDQLGQLRQGP